MHKTNRLLYILAAIKFLLPFLLQDSFYQPHRDEYLYLSEGWHPAWGYLEVPPLLSVFAWLTNHLGGGQFWIKLWPNLTGVCTLLLTGKIIRSLGGKSFAVLLGCLPLMLGGYLRLFYLLHPNFLDVFFWTLQFFSLIRYVQSRENKWLYLFGAAAGLGMMSKYSSAFCIISLLAGLLITQERRIFGNKHLYGAALLALIIFLPNLLWQYNHRFPVVNHMEELHDEQLKYISPAAFMVSQLMMNLQFIFVWMAGLLFALFSRPGKPYRFCRLGLSVHHARAHCISGKRLLCFRRLPGPVCLRRLLFRTDYDPPDLASLCDHRPRCSCMLRGDAPDSARVQTRTAGGLLQKDRIRSIRSAALGRPAAASAAPGFRRYDRLERNDGKGGQGVSQSAGGTTAKNPDFVPGLFYRRRPELLRCGLRAADGAQRQCLFPVLDARPLSNHQYPAGRSQHTWQG